MCIVQVLSASVLYAIGIQFWFETMGRRKYTGIILQSVATLKSQGVVASAKPCEKDRFVVIPHSKLPHTHTRTRTRRLVTEQRAAMSSRMSVQSEITTIHYE